ncbi:Hypothetical predicted protein, partial [Paramuricea clavata]
MESHGRRKKSRSIAALVFLTIIGVGFLFFGLVTITCGFIVNYLEDFEVTDGGQALESAVESEFDYTQYWLGFPFLITAVLSVCSGLFQTTRSLTSTTVVFFHLCIILSLFAMVLEGVDWVTWKNMDSLRKNWEDKDGYSCSSVGHSCVCAHTTTNATMPVSSWASCSNISSLSGLFGAITASAIIGIFLSLAGIVVILNSLSWKPHRYLV